MLFNEYLAPFWFWFAKASLLKRSPLQMCYLCLEPGPTQSWVKPTEAPGGAEEAHRRWPAGRSEQGREQGKG
jgi:hypothetical protein